MPRVHCPSESELLRYVERTGDSDRTRELEAHLDDCRACLQSVCQYVATPTEDVASIGSRYVLIDVLGSGATGVVYRAFDPVLDRTVALKVVNLEDLPAALSGDDALAEARTLASLSHPNLVIVHDAGRHGARIYFAMELVDGGDLRSWLEQSPRSTAEIVALFAGVAAALATVHAAGVVHRDLKPENILVDAQGQPKVADFGLADVVAPRAVTVGTPAYMAPEQLASEGVADHRADQFALAVSLYEALWGCRPTPDAAVPRRVGLPPRRRRAIQRALSKDPQQRFESMGQLRDALQTGRPRWVGVAGVGAGLAILGVLAMSRSPVPDARCGGASAAWDERWVGGPRASVRGALERAGRASEFELLDARMSAFAASWIEAHEDACAATTIRGEQSAELLDKRMACLRRAANSADAVHEVLSRPDVPPPPIPTLLGTLVELRDCSDLDALRRAGPLPPPAVRAKAEQISALLSRTHAYLVAGDLERVHELLETIGDPSTVWGPLATAAQRSRASLAEHEARIDDAEAHLRRTLRLAHQHDQPEEVFLAVVMLARHSGETLDRFEEAQAFLTVAESLAPDDRGEFLVEQLRGDLAMRTGALETAEAAYRRALSNEAGPHDDLPDIARGRIRWQLARVLGSLGRPREGIELLELLLPELERAWGPEHPEPAQARANYAALLYSAERLDEAQAQYEAALEVLDARLGSSHPAVVAIRVGYASVLGRVDRTDDAIEVYRDALAKLRDVAEPTDPLLLATRANLAGLLGRDQPAEALTMTRELLDIHIERDLPVANRAMVRSLVAANLGALQRFPEAIEQAERALSELRTVREPCHPKVRQLRANEAKLHYAAGDLKAGDRALDALEAECSEATEHEREQWLGDRVKAHEGG